MLLLDCLGDAVRGIGIASGETLPTPGALLHIQNQTLFFTPLGAGGSGLCRPCDIMRPELMVVRASHADVLFATVADASKKKVTALTDYFLGVQQKEARLVSNGGGKFMLCDPRALARVARASIPGLIPVNGAVNGGTVVGPVVGNLLRKGAEAPVRMQYRHHRALAMKYKYKRVMELDGQCSYFAFATDPKYCRPRAFAANDRGRELPCMAEFLVRGLQLTIGHFTYIANSAGPIDAQVMREPALLALDTQADYYGGGTSIVITGGGILMALRELYESGDHPPGIAPWDKDFDIAESCYVKRAIRFQVRQSVH